MAYNPGMNTVFAIARWAESSETAPSHWYGSPEWLLVAVGIATAIVIGWQSWETRRAASATQRAVIATLRPQLKLLSIALIPGKLVEVDGITTLQDDHEWRVECIIANSGGTNGRVVESNLTISHLGIGTLEGLIPPFPRYGTSRDSLGTFTVLPGERRQMTLVLDRNTDTMRFRFLRSMQQAGTHTATTKVICFGFIHYLDDADIGRRTGFGFEYKVEDMSFTRLEHPSYEYAD
jgi:hypothetical protein